MRQRYAGYLSERDACQLQREADQAEANRKSREAIYEADVAENKRMGLPPPVRDPDDN